jgi:hypothetical protein
VILAGSKAKLAIFTAIVVAVGVGLGERVGDVDGVAPED